MDLMGDFRKAGERDKIQPQSRICSFLDVWTLGHRVGLLRDKMAEVITVLNNGDTVDGASVTIDWTQGGVPAGSDKGITGSNGTVSFNEPINLGGGSGNVFASKFPFYGTGTCPLNILGDGSATINVSFQPFRGLENWLGQIGETFDILLALFLVLIAVFAIFKFWADPVGTLSGAAKKAKETATEAKEKIEEKKEEKTT